MNVAKHLWTSTKGLFALTQFPNQIAPFLKHVNSPAEILTAQEHMHLILWRWTHLEVSPKISTTPSLFLHDIREAEGWPATGQFFPTAALATTKQNIKDMHLHVDISVNLDFIDFTQQPLIADLIQIHMHTPVLYPWGSPYTTLIEHIYHVLGPLINKKQLQPMEIAYATCCATFQYHISQWYDERPYIQDVFTPDTWHSFWQTQLKKIGNTNGLSTDMLLDAYTNTMRTVFPDFSLTNKELGAYRPKTNEHPNIQFMEQYEFWLSFGQHMLLPLSLYLHLIEPVYMDTQNFTDDVNMLINNPPEQYPLFGPCTHLYLTDFGQLFLASLDRGMYKEVVV